MTIFVAADHRGFTLKERLLNVIRASGSAVEDAGAYRLDPADDYVDFARAAAEKIREHPVEYRGIFICGSGIGMDVVANKFPGLRSALAADVAGAIQSREHVDANVLVLAADALTPERAEEIVHAWLSTPFSGEERHVRRLKKIAEVERRNFK